MFNKLKSLISAILTVIALALGFGSVTSQAAVFDGGDAVTAATAEIAGQLTSVTGLLTAGVAILGMFLVWRLIKRFVK